MIAKRSLRIRMLALCSVLCLAVQVLAIEWQDQSIFRVNKEPPHATKMPFASEEAALEKQRMESSYCQLLNGEWKYQWSRRPDERPFEFYRADFDDSAWGTIPVPANVEIEGHGTPIYTNSEYPFVRNAPSVMDEPPTGWTGHRDRNPVSSYRRTFTVPAEWDGRQTFVVFNGVDSAFYLWCNGQQVGYSQDSRTPAEFNLTPYLREGENVLAVEVYRYSDGSYLEDQDFWRLSGIFRDVYLWSAGELDLRDFEIHASLDDAYEQGTLSVRTWTKNYGDENQNYTVEAKLLDGDREMSRLMIVGEASADAEHEAEGKIGKISVEPWSAETPKLYWLLLMLKDGAGEPVAYYSRKIGFRTSEIKNGNLLVNGKPILIKGVNRHDHHHITGHTISEDAMREDLDQMKRLNVNAIRTSHYPNDPRFAELVDEYGFYMVSEANIETHGYGRSGNPLPKDMTWFEAHLDRMRNNIELHKNHASAIIWSMGNEAGDGPIFAKCLDWIHDRDPSRPVQYENAHVSDYRPRTAVDIFAPMYFRINRYERHLQREEEKPADEQRPLIQCEYSHAMGNSCGGLADYWELIREHRLAQGGFIWDWRDQGLIMPSESEASGQDLSSNDLPIVADGEFSADDGLTAGHVTVAHADSLALRDAVTLVADVRIASNSGNNPIICKGDTSYSLKTNANGELEFFVHGDGVWHHVVVPLGDSWLGTWRRVAGSFDGEMVRLFVDGQEIASEEFAGEIGQNDYPLGIGHDAEYTQRTFNGNIRQAAVYSRALSADEIGQPGELPTDAMVFGVDLRQIRSEENGAKPEFAYGGDFGDAPNSDNFCMNGVVAADCTPNPHAHEVFHQYRNILVEPVDMAEPTVKLSVTNENFFRDIEGQPFHWQLTRNGELESEGNGTLPSCPPQESVEIEIETGAEPQSDGEYVLTVEFEQGVDRSWADANFVVAREQVMLPWNERTVAPHESEGEVTISGDEQIVVEGDGFAAQFDAATGQLTSYKTDGVERLAGPLRLNFWRPPTDNDRGNGMPRNQRVWRTAGDQATATAATHDVVDGVGKLAFDIGVPAEQSTARLEYDVFADGVIEVRMQFEPAGDDLPPLPRVGMQCQVTGELTKWSWYGRGPWENYVDRNTGAYLGIHSGAVDDLWYRYSEPQETANRTDVRWATFTGGDEQGLRFTTADDQLLEVGAYPFDQEDLEGKRHASDIPARDHITVHIAHAQMGIAGEDSWGAQPLRKYRLSSNRKYSYAFRIEPVR